MNPSNAYRYLYVRTVVTVCVQASHKYGVNNELRSLADVQIIGYVEELPLFGPKENNKNKNN
jgi:hypothetical protein